MKLFFAPLQGYTDEAYRRLHSTLYGGVDEYVTPFVRTHAGEPMRRDVARLQAAMADDINTVPQVIFGSVDECRCLVDMVKSIGFKRVDLNLGCPYPMQTSHGRGAAMMGRLDVMQAVAAMVNADSEMQYSVKMRLGMTEATEWHALMPILNSMPLRHIAVHLRVGRQMYDGEMHTVEFARILSESVHPVIWNGDIHLPEDISRLAEAYPTMHGVMIGRGMLARPSLAAEWKEGRTWSREERIATLLRFHDSLYNHYCHTLCGDTQILQKIKPFWDYLEQEIGRKAWKALHKAGSIKSYDSARAKFTL